MLDTIFAPITSINQSGVCVIRISGDKTLDCLEKLGVNTSKISHQKIIFNKILDLKNNEVIDECLISYFKAPNSFTGQDIAEISIHASTYIFQKISEILSKIEDVRMAQAGEFSKRAFLNNKMSLIEAEAIPDLIASETELQHKQALRQLSGKIGKIYDDLRQKIIEILALIEAVIDFPDEDLPENIIKDIKQNLANIKKIINEILANHIAQKIKTGINLAIIGEPNVGKSTLLNFLAKSEIAIVSDVAGTTRDIIETHLNIAGAVVKIADTAGIRTTQDKIEEQGVIRAIKKSKDCDIKILMLDAKKLEISDKIANLIDKNTLVLINKIDEINHLVQQKIDQKISDLIKNKANITFDSQNLLKISLKNQQNLDLLISLLEQEVKKQIPNNNSAIITQERHRSHLKSALAHLEEFSFSKPIELAAEDLRLASQEIGKITGKIGVENILDVIFGSFCIGK